MTSRRPLAVVATAALTLSLLGAVTSAEEESGGPPLVANGSFEAPDVSAYGGTAGAAVERVRQDAYRGAHALSVTSSGDPDSGVATEAVRDTGAGSHLLTLAVRGTASSIDKVVRAVVVDPVSGDRTTSAPVHLTPWWQTVGVTATTSGSPLRFAVEETDDGGGWASGDRYLLDVVDARRTVPTRAATSGRQLLVDGDPYTIRAYGYGPTPIGAPGSVPSAAAMAGSWQTTPAQCQSDAQLMRAAGVNTLRISFADVYTDDAYRCLDAFHAADVKLLWLVNGPQTWQGSNLPAYQELFWETLSRTITAVKDHPATIGYVIGNENSRGAMGQQAAWMSILDELSQRTHDLDPVHVTSTSLAGNQFHGGCTNGDCWGGVGPDVAPDIDLWGHNQYGYGTGWAQDTIDQDPTRPTWVSEFGRRRYWCAWFNPAFGLNIVLDQVACSISNGSGEDVGFQRDWLTNAWNEIAANLSGDDPDGAVVGGSVHAWADYWWFAFPGLVTLVSTPFTHEVHGRGWNTPVEWFGTNHAMLAHQTGPRVATESFDRMATLYTGGAVPVVSDAVVIDVGACTAVVRWTTDVPTYGRADYGLDRQVAVGDAVYQENFVADHHVQDTQLRSSHALTLTDLVPGQVHQVHVRGFDELGATGTSPAIEFTTPAGTCT